MLNKMRELYEFLYGNTADPLWDEFATYVSELKKDHKPSGNPTWFKEGAVYCLYPDSFGGGFSGLSCELDYFKGLGIKTLWLLPSLESPGHDQGFDISDYENIRADLGGNKAFISFLEKAHSKGLRVIFDVAINHTSNCHAWFKAASEPGSEYRDYYIWNKTDDKYGMAHVIFKGMLTSNWEKHSSGEYYFHRFYPFQPDLNYRNPRVLLEMTKVFLKWRNMGVDGFRMDAAPYLWKEEGTTCESLPQTHAILKFFRAALDEVYPGTLILAESCLPMEQLKDYFGSGDECHAAFHFPLMTKFYLAIAEKKPELLDADYYYEIPRSCVMFNFLRVHDELTLGLNTEEERYVILKNFLLDERWDFGVKHGISSRIYDLMGGNPDRVLMAYSLLFSMPGMPVIYYGDEIGQKNNYSFFEEKAKSTGYPDSRFIHRGQFDFSLRDMVLSERKIAEQKIYGGIKAMLEKINYIGSLIAEKPHLSFHGSVLVSERINCNKRLKIVTNLGMEEIDWNGGKIPGHGYLWTT